MLLTCSGWLHAQTGSILPLRTLQVFDSSGRPLSSGRLLIFEAGTSTPLPTLDTGSETSPAPHIIQLDANGTAPVFQCPQPCRVLAQDSEGVHQWTVDGLRDPNYLAKHRLADVVYRPQPLGFEQSSPRMFLRAAGDSGLGMLNVRDFGSKGDGVTDDTTAIRQAAEAANEQRRTLFFPAGKYLVSSGGFDIDANRTGWWGDGAEIHLTRALPGGYLIRLFSTASYETARANNRAALYGLAITGGGLGPAREYPETTAILYGDDKQDTNSLFTTEHVSVDGFAYPMGFRANVYMWQIEKCYIRGGRIVVPGGLKNFGERMVVRDSVLADTTYQVTEFKSGYWSFENVSFDNIPLRIAGDAVAWFTGCHFENAGGHAPYRYLSIDIEGGVPGEAHIISSNVVNNPPTDSQYWDQPLFWVHPDIRNDRGLHLQNVRMPNSNTYRSERSEGNRVLVGGGGRVSASGVTTFTQTGSQWALSRYESLLVNPGFEQGLNGWTNAGSSGGQWSADASSARVGHLALRLTSTAGRMATAGQTFPVTPGRHVSASVWLRHVVQGRGALEVALIWLDVAGNRIGQTGSLLSFTANTDWTLRTVMATDAAPAGTTHATILFRTQATSGTASSWIDDVLMTVL